MSVSIVRIFFFLSSVGFLNLEVFEAEKVTRKKERKNSNYSYAQFDTKIDNFYHYVHMILISIFALPTY